MKKNILMALLTVLPFLCLYAAPNIDLNHRTGAEVIVTLQNEHQLTAIFKQDESVLKESIVDGVAPLYIRYLALPDQGEVTLLVDEIFSNQISDDLGKTLSWAEYSSIAHSPVELGSEILIDGVRMIEIRFMPLIQKSNKTDYVQECRVTFNLPADPQMNRMRRIIREMWGSLILNNNIPGRDRSEEGTNGAWVYVIPDMADVREAIAPLVRWRQLQGYPTREVAVSRWMGSDWVLQTLQGIVSSGVVIDYICLVGDVDGDYRVPTVISAGESDYNYTLLEGNDLYPDAAVGRLSYNSIGQLQRIVSKVISYEQNPNIDDPMWFRRGAVIAGNEISGLSTILASRWARNRMLEYGYASVDTFWFTMGRDIAGFMNNAFSQGKSFISYRGWTGVENWSQQDALRLANRYLPVTLLLACNTGDYAGPVLSYSEALLLAQGGAIGAIGTTGAGSRVEFNNMLLTGFTRALYDDGISRIGWTLNRAKLELISVYGDRARGFTIDHCRWTNLIGDPATLLWRGSPARINIEVPEQVNYGEGRAAVRVLRQNNNAPVANARVGLFKTNEICVAGYTNAEGWANLTFEPRRVTQGQAIFTVSGDRILPNSAETQLTRPARQMAYTSHFIQEDNWFPREGNGDGAANPFETISIVTVSNNIGSQQINPPVIFTLSSDGPGCRVVENRVVHQTQVNPNGQVSASFLVQLLGDFPDQQPVGFTLTISNGGNDWISNFTISGVAARWSVGRITRDNEPGPGTEVGLFVRLANTGNFDIGITDATLQSRSQLAEVLIEAARYPEVGVGDTVLPDTTFRIRFADNTPYGISVPFNLHLESEEGFITDLPLSIRIIDAPPSMTTGPDEYGYWAIDNLDIMSNLRPQNEWIEINPRAGGRGVNTGLLDLGEDRDMSIVLNMPFNFQFYGRRYDLLTVCTNGWAAFGDQRGFVDFRNLPIVSSQGPVAMLAPWWDDLYMPFNECAIYTYFDAVRHRYIVQWDRMRRWVGPDGPGAMETFQIVLYDPAWYPTYTGDGDIIFNYLSVSHEFRVDGHGTPYPTIGIRSPSGRSGLQYGFWDRYSPGARRPEAGSSIRYSTANQHYYGTVNGRVLAAIDSTPVFGATIRSSRGGWTESIEDGIFVHNKALANLPFTLSASAPGFIEKSSDELRVVAGGAIETIFYLNSPSLEIDVRSISDSLDAGTSSEHDFTISNPGDGVLSYRLSVTASNDQALLFSDNRLSSLVSSKRDDPDEPWQSLFSLAVSDSTGDQRILGVLFNGDRFIFSGGNNGRDVNYLYRFNRLGRQLDRFVQPVSGAWGIHDLAYNGVNYFGGSGDYIYKFGEDGREISRTRSPINPSRALAVDPVGRLWTTTPGAPIYVLAEDGNIIRTYEHNLRPYGLAWHPADPDGCPLWVFSADGISNLAVSKMDTSNGRFYSVTELQLREGDIAGGCEMTLQWDDRHWCMVTLIQNPSGDRLEVFEVGPNLTWLTVNPQLGQIQPGERQEFRVLLSSEMLNGGNYAADIVIEHNAFGVFSRVPVHLVVNPLLTDVEENYPFTHIFATLYPNPSNGLTTLRFNLFNEQNVSFALYDHTGRQVDYIDSGILPRGMHTQSFDVSHLPTGVYFLKLNLGYQTITRKFVLLK